MGFREDVEETVTQPSAGEFASRLGKALALLWRGWRAPRPQPDPVAVEADAAVRRSLERARKDLT